MRSSVAIQENGHLYEFQVDEGLGENTSPHSSPGPEWKGSLDFVATYQPEIEDSPILKKNIDLSFSFENVVENVSSNLVPISHKGRLSGLSRFLTYSMWERLLVVVAIVVAVVAFVSSLIHAGPELLKLFEGLISTAYAAGPVAQPKSPTDLTNIKDIGITGFFMILCLWSAGVYFHGGNEDRKKVAADLIKLTLGFLGGKTTR